MKNTQSNKKLREFGYFIGLGFPLIIGFLIPLLSGHNFRLWTLLISIISLILAKFKPNLLFYPYKFWMKLGYILGWINSRLILGLVFFVVLLPIAMIMRIFGYDPLKLKKNVQLSYEEKKINHKIDLTRIF